MITAVKNWRHFCLHTDILLPAFNLNFLINFENYICITCVNCLGMLHWYSTQANGNLYYTLSPIFYINNALLVNDVATGNSRTGIRLMVHIIFYIQTLIV